MKIQDNEGDVSGLAPKQVTQVKKIRTYESDIEDLRYKQMLAVHRLREEGVTWLRIGAATGFHHATLYQRYRRWLDESE